jgi:hypothetical protein
VSVLADLAADLGFAPDAWRRMGWREFTAWVGEIARRRDEERASIERAQQRQEREQAKAEFLRTHGVLR